MPYGTTVGSLIAADFRTGKRASAAHICKMAQRCRPRLLEVRVIPLKPDRWEWQVCEDDTPLVMGYETTRETAQIGGVLTITKIQKK